MSDGLLVNFFTHRFFATYVRACPTMHEDIKIISRAASVLTDQTRLVRLRFKGKYIESQLPRVRLQRVRVYKEQISLHQNNCL